jgi:hypothetical protein
MDDRRQDPLRVPGRTLHLLRKASALTEEARRNGATLHSSARHLLQQAERLLASGRMEMDRGDARLAATFAHLAFEEAGKAMALCGSPLNALPGRTPQRGA